MVDIKKVAIPVGFAVLALVAVFGFLRPAEVIESEKLRIMTFRDTKESAALKVELAKVRAENVALKERVDKATTVAKDIRTDEQVERIYGPDGKVVKEIITKRTVDNTKVEAKSTSTTESTAASKESIKENTEAKTERTDKEKTDSISSSKTTVVNSAIWIAVAPTVQFNANEIKFDLKNTAAIAGVDLFPGVVLQVFALPGPGYFGAGPGLKF